MSNTFTKRHTGTVFTCHGLYHNFSDATRSFFWHSRENKVDLLTLQECTFPHGQILIGLETKRENNGYFCVFCILIGENCRSEKYSFANVRSFWRRYERQIKARGGLNCLKMSFFFNNEYSCGTLQTTIYTC